MFNNQVLNRSESERIKKNLKQFLILLKILFFFMVQQNVNNKSNLIINGKQGSPTPCLWLLRHDVHVTKIT